MSRQRGQAMQRRRSTDVGEPTELGGGSEVDG